MVTQLYIPVNSRNFNMLFATESLSPAIHYAKRMFGNKRFIDIPNNRCPEHILLFDLPPKIELNDDEVESTIFYIRIKTNRLNGSLCEVINNNDHQVFSYSETIYFNLCNPDFIFNSSNEIRRIVARSFSAAETKTVSKYYSSFITLDEANILLHEYDLATLSLEPILFIDDLLLKDSVINKYKGFIYGYFIGKMFPGSIEEIEFRKSLQNILNYWAGFKSESSLASSLSKQKGKEYASIYSESADQTKGKLLQSVNDTLNLLEVLMPDSTKDDFILQHLAKFIEQAEISNFLKNIKLFPELYTTLRHIAGENLEDPFYLIEIIGDCVDSSIKIEEFGSKGKGSTIEEMFDNKIKDSIFKLQSHVDGLRLVKTNTNTIPDLSHLKFNYQTLSIEDKSDSTKDDFQIFEIILNCLLKNKAKGSTLSTEEKTALVKNVGHLVKEAFGDESEARKYLLGLYNVVSGKAGAFDISRTTFNSLINFSAFMFKPDSLEQLENYLDNKYIPEKYMAYSYWGMYFGFSMMSKNFTKYVFENGDSRLTNLIDTHFINGVSNLNQDSFNVETSNKDQTYQIVQESGKQFDLAIGIELDEALSPFIPWVKMWVEDTINKLTFGNENKLVPNIDELKNRFIGDFTAKKRKGYTQKLAKQILAKIDFKSVFEQYENQKSEIENL